MLHFSLLRNLERHFTYLDTVLSPGRYYIVWGALRDVLLGHEHDPTDIDLTWPGLPDEIWTQIQQATWDTFRTEKFGTMSLLIENTSYEFTPFRTEGTYADFRRPDEISWTNDLLADSKRRDFTINACYASALSLAPHTIPAPDSSLTYTIADRADATSLRETHPAWYMPAEHILYISDHQTIAQVTQEWALCLDACRDLLEQVPHVTWTRTPVSSSSSPASAASETLLVIVDPHHGVYDLVMRTITAVGDPHQRFSEDALRVLRAVRFANKLNNRLDDTDDGYDFTHETWHAMKKAYYLVSYIAKERIREEIVKVFQDHNPMWYIALLDELNLLKFIFPALAATKHVPQPVRYHSFDVYAHTLLTLHAVQWLTDQYLTRLAMLYHDVGKTDQYYYFGQHISKEEKRLPLTHHMYHAQSLSPELAKQDFTALGFSRKEIETICTYITYHHRPGELLECAPDKRKKKLRQLLSTLGYEACSEIIKLALADRLGQHNPMQPPQLQRLYLLEQELQELYEEEGRFTLDQLALNGTLLMETFELPPGPHVGRLLDLAFQWVMNNIAERNQSDTIIAYLRGLAELQTIQDRYRNA